jgi:hypothetical protein
MTEDRRNLAALEELEKQLESVLTVDEAMGLRDGAAALEAYANSAKLSLAMQNHAAFIKVRAVHRAGELLKEMDLREKRRDRFRSRPVGGRHLGLTPAESRIWQTIAELPLEIIAQMERQLTELGVELTTARVYDRALAEKGIEKSPTGPTADPIGHTVEELVKKWSGFLDGPQLIELKRLSESKHTTDRQRGRLIRHLGYLRGRCESAMNLLRAQIPASDVYISTSETNERKEKGD